MSDPAQAEGEPPKRKSKWPLIIGLVLMLGLGGGGFYATYSGLLLGGDGTHAEAAAPGEDAVAVDAAFVPITPLVISLGDGGGARHLRFAAQLEVGKATQEAVTELMPRVLDVLNGYLRAVEVRELEDPTALIRLRAQMLRRVQIVTGEGQVRDLLISEFVLN